MNVLKYFKEAGNEEYVIRYAELLAKYYYQLEEYKLACEYFEMSFQALKHKSSVL
jgi:HTH-type transcriptional regulator, quorum sensing regulator NprR